MRKELLTPRDDIFVIRDFLSAETCDRFVSLTESKGYAEAPINTFAGAVVDKSMRSNDRVMIDDFHEAATLWENLKSFVQPLDRWQPIALNERLRFYRYEPGQEFDWHFDGSFRRSEREMSFLTVLIYLNSGCEGGTTDFLFRSGTVRESDIDVRVAPERGMALVFPHQVLHRGACVTRGKKYVLRSDVMYRREAAT